MTDLKKFADQRLYKIHGFMHPADAMAFAGILDFQARQNWRGTLAEIGVFYGRSLALMAASARPDEKILAMDLFDIGGQQAYVEAMLAREAPGKTVEILAGSSLDIQADDLNARAGGIRLFSVDGGHELVHIENDAKLALDTLAPFGVIAFDDFMNSQYPDLSLGILRFLEEHRADLKAFLITKAKLFVAKADYYPQYLEAVRAMPLWSGAYREEFDFLGNRIVHVSQSIPHRGLYQQFAKLGLGGLANRMTHRRRFARH